MFKKFRGRRDKSQAQLDQPQEELPYRASPPLAVPLEQYGESRRDSEATAFVKPDDSFQRIERPASQHSAISNFNITPPSLNTRSSKDRQKSQDRRTDPRGLTVLYSPGLSRSADIIFVHGLGGSSRLSWSRNRDLDFCWPQFWLPKEPEISSARILSFGYDANFSSTGSNSISNIGDFAKALLYDMKFGKDDASQDLAVGDVPIIFVVHSMGGLVFKKAYTSGQNNPDYKNIIAEVRAVLFLSTPHRGTNLTVMLNRILSTSFIGHNSKQYIAELNKGSPAIETLNEDFRNVAPKLQIFCFYETLQTSVALKTLMVLDKESSILGYPGEISRPLDADHHNVCKYTSPDDPNYKSVLSALLTLVRNYNLTRLQKNTSKALDDCEKIESFLDVGKAPEDDYQDSKNRWQPGTCDSFLFTSEILDWTQYSNSTIMWVYARPGSGKSVFSSYIINHLLESGCTCAYYFFKYQDATKRSLNSLLRSLAFQIAQDLPEFQQALTSLYGEGVRLDKSDSRGIWQKLFVSILFKLDCMRPMYWVVDALDESDSLKAVLETLATISGSKVPIKLLVTSRDLPVISTAFDRISTLPKTRLCLDDNADDIRHYATSQMQYMYGGDDFRRGVVDQIVDLAQGNFLWADLAIKQVMRCHDPADIYQALSELPPGMDALYQRMEANISRLIRPADLALSLTILTWATFARRPLTKEELLHILKADSSVPLDLTHTINEVCGHFVIVNGNERVTLVHQTAREYLVKARDLPFSLSPSSSHETLLLKSLAPFFDPKLRTRIRQKNFPAFYEYAATSWSFHLDWNPPASNKVLDNLVRFFRGTHALIWIESLASLGKVHVLVFASRSIQAFVQKRRRLDSHIVPLLHRESDLCLLETWATDLLRIVGKFSYHLVQDPAAIYKYIPQLCPSSSMIHQSTKNSKTSFSVTGLETAEWDDCLARLSVGNGKEALMVISYGRHLAVSTSAGCVILWNSLTFEVVRTFVHGEHILRMCFSSEGRELASYGLRTTRVWDVSSGHQLHIAYNPSDARALAFAFAEGDETLIMASDTRKVSKLRLDGKTEEWETQNEGIMEEDTSIPGTFLNSPMGLAFSPDMTELAVAYRGYPLTVWSLEDTSLVNRCKRRTGYHQISTNSWTGVNRVCWHPTSGDVLGIYTDGMVFKWHPIGEAHQELSSKDIHATPSEIECSPDGIIFATSDVNGAVKLYNFHYFSLIYQLSSEDIVTALCFSPDGKRFYDLRGSYCNAWEPNALIRLTGLEEAASDNRSEDGRTSVSIPASEAFVETPVIITALAASLKAGIIFTGDEDGEVRILDMTCKPQQEIGKSATEMSIDLLACTGDGNHFAYTDLGGRLVVREVNKLENSSHTWGSHVQMNVKLNTQLGGTRQLLLSPGGEYVLLVNFDSAQLWSTSKQLIIAVSLPSKPGTVHKWITHPLQADQLLSITLSAVQVYDWETLTPRGSYSILLPAIQDEETPDLPREDSQQILQSLDAEESSIDGIIISQALNILLLSVSNPTTHQHQLIILETTNLSTPSSHPIPSKTLHPSLLNTIALPLAILGNGNLVYLDSSFWVCTWRLGSAHGVEKCQRHFFLPRDWVSVESMAHYQVLGDGTLLCPRKGEVAVIRSTLGVGW